jgi:hypothetical protein
MLCNRCIKQHFNKWDMWNNYSDACDEIFAEIDNGRTCLFCNCSDATQSFPILAY